MANSPKETTARWILPGGRAASKDQYSSHEMTGRCRRIRTPMTEDVSRRINTDPEIFPQPPGKDPSDRGLFVPLLTVAIASHYLQ